MPATGEVFPTSGTTTSEAPWSDNTWSSPGNVVSNNALYASVTAGTYDAGDQTFVLKAFGFDFSAIPAGSTIDGVTARVEARGDSVSVFIDLAQLLDVSGAKVGTNLALAPTNDIALTTTDTVYTIGGAANLWGNALDLAWVQDPEFGIALGARADVANSEVYIDYVTLDITYTEPAGPIVVNPALETDSALVVGKVDPIFAAVTMATETDSALALTVVDPILAVVGTATETDSSLVVTPVMGGGGPFFVNVLTALETDSALSVGVADPILRVVGTASETDTALALGVVDPIVGLIALAAETDSALAITVEGSARVGTLGDVMLASLRVIYPGTESVTALLQRYREDNGLQGWDAYTQHVASGSPTDNLMDDQWGFWS